MTRAERFEGRIGRTLADSEPWFDEPPHPGESAPNVVVVLLDDTGFAQLGCYGSTIDTPNIDALAAGGATFTQAYAQTACVPARAMLMAGRWPQRNSVGAIWNNGPPPPASVVTLAERLREHGYATALVGKWHLGQTTGKHPLDQGFDHFFGFEGRTPAYYGHDPLAPLHRGRQRIQNTGYVTDTLAAEAVRLLQAERSQPLFLYVPLTATHDPLQTTMEVLKSDDYASGRHARLTRHGGLLYVEDMGSTNGTFVNGRKTVGATPLRHGDTVRIGSTSFRYEE